MQKAGQGCLCAAHRLRTASAIPAQCILWTPDLGCRACRYADVMVHRVLAATLGIAPLPPSMRDAPGLRSVVDNLNLRHHNAQMAGRASVELHTLIYFRDRVTVADARITRVGPGAGLHLRSGRRIWSVFTCRGLLVHSTEMVFT